MNNAKKYGSELLVVHQCSQPRVYARKSLSIKRVITSLLEPTFYVLFQSE